MIVEVPVSVGELIDKITILQLKHRFARTDEQRSNVDRELQLLQQRADGVNLGGHPMFEGIVAELTRVNRQLWDLEDVIRGCIRNQDFGEVYMNTAQEIPRANDRRAELKRIANDAYHSSIVEEKIYD